MYRPFLDFAGYEFYVPRFDIWYLISNKVIGETLD